LLQVVRQCYAQPSIEFCAMSTFVLVFLAGLAVALTVQNVVTLTTADFDEHVKVHKHTLVEFYAPWCGNCKKLAPEFEQAATDLKEKGISLAKVDATTETELATKYDVKNYPKLIWFEDGEKHEFDGGRTAAAMVEWIESMAKPAVVETVSPESPTNMPRIVLYAPSLLDSFANTAKANRRKATWYFVKQEGAPKAELMHTGHEPIELTNGVDDKEALLKLLSDNALPLFGHLDGDTYPKYMESGKGLVWSLFEGNAESFETEKRPMMLEIAKKFQGKYLVSHCDIVKFKDAIEAMLGVTKFPTIAVQQKAGSKKKFTYSGNMSVAAISKFIEDVEAGAIEPVLKSEPIPKTNDEPVRVVVGYTIQQELFTPDMDVLVDIYAPWCGHCKKLEPEFLKVAKKVKKEGLSDLVKIAKLDGSLNDSPVDSIEYAGFPTLYFVKAGATEPEKYDGGRDAKAIWQWIKKNSSKAKEIKERTSKKKPEVADKKEEL